MNSNQSLPAGTPRNVIVVGGGIIGASVAYYLGRRGVAVTLIERDGFETSASTGNAGLIALGHAPLPRPGLFRQTLRMLLDPASPLYIPPRLDLDLFRWLWHFQRACSQRQFDHAMNVLGEFGWIAGESFDRLIEEESIDCCYDRSGWIEVFATEHRLHEGRADAELVNRYGYQTREIGREELRAMEPAYRESVIGAIHYTDSRVADPGRCLRELAGRLGRHGVAVRVGRAVRRLLRDGERVRGVELSDAETIEADAIVLAAGIWTSDLAREIGVRVPMQPAKGYHLHLAMPDPAPKLGSILSEAFVAVNPACGALRLAGTLEFSGINHNIRQNRADMLRINAAKFLHGIEEAPVLSTWCGLRPCTADGLPVIGWAPGAKNLFIATGHAMLGFALGPGTGRLAAEAITGEKPAMDMQCFSPARYA